MVVLEEIIGKTQVDQETRQGLEKLLGRALQASYDSSTLLREQVKTWRDQYEGILPTKSQKWSSNVNIPETKEAINISTVNITRAALGVDPIFEVEALDPEFDEVAQEEENWLQYWNERTRLRSKGGLAIKDALITGQVWLKPGVKATGKQLPDMTQMMGAPLAVDQLDAVPTCEYVITEDMLLLPSTAPNFQSANGAFGKKWLRWDEILGGSESKAFYPDAVDRVKGKWAEEKTPTQIHDQQGIYTEEPEELWQASFQCWEGIFRWAKSGERREREWLILAVWDVEQGGDPVILRMTPYRELFGEQWFFVPIISNPRPNSMWGTSMCEDIRGLQNVTNTLFNGMVDAIQIALLPPIAVPPGSDIARRNLKWGPMERWPVANPADVKVLEPASGSIAAISAGLGNLEYIRQSKERVTGTTDVTAGRPNNEARTKFEISAVITAGNQIFEHQVTTLQLGMDEGHGFQAYAEGVMNIIKRFLPKQPIQYKSRNGGNQPWQIVRPEWHEGQYEFIPRGNSSNSNPETRLQQAMALMQVQQTSPFTQLSPLDTPESLLEKVQRLYKAQAAQLQALGEKHIESYIGGEPETFEEALQIAATLNPQIAQLIAERAAQQRQAGQATEQGMLPPPTGSAGLLPGGMVEGASEPGFGGFGGAGGPAEASGLEGVPGLNIPSGMVPV